MDPSLQPSTFNSMLSNNNLGESGEGYIPNGIFPIFFRPDITEYSSNITTVCLTLMTINTQSLNRPTNKLSLFIRKGDDQVLWSVVLFRIFFSSFLQLLLNKCLKYS